MTAIELGKSIKSGELTSVDAVKLALQAASSDKYNSYIAINEGATGCADKVDAMIKSGELSGPLAGVPISIKDNICTLGLETTCASRILKGFVPPYNATVVEKLEAAGMVVIGKLNMDEFAMGSTSETSYYGKVLNPWNENHVPGGSSGGSAAAVAAGSAVCAIGSDTGGSIRQPASFCSVTGIKPTYGAVSRYGLVAYASSLDQIGPIARDAADCAAILDIICGKDERDSTSALADPTQYYVNLSTDIKGLRIGVPEQCFPDALDQEVSAAVKAASSMLFELGASVETFSMPLIKYVTPTYYIIACAEASSNLSRFDGVKYGYRAGDYEDLSDLYIKTRSEGFGEEVKRRIMLGTFTLSAGYYDAYYKKALKVRSLIKAQFDAAFEKYDLILTPTVPNTAPKLGSSLQDPLKMYLTDSYTASVNLAGLPAISMPCGFSSEGLPIGAQLIGKAFGEQTILNAAHAYQSVTDYHKREARV